MKRVTMASVQAIIWRLFSRRRFVSVLRSWEKDKQFVQAVKKVDKKGLDALDC